MAVSYEWVVEAMDGDEIIDTSAYPTLAEAITVTGCWAVAADRCVISLRRDVGNNVEGMTDRQQAYFGDEAFDAGAAIPKHLLADFRSIPAEFRS